MTEPTRHASDPNIVKMLEMVLDQVVRGAEHQQRYNDKLDARLDVMVTKAEFKAEVGRIDAERAALSKEVSAGLGTVQAAMSEGFNEIKKQGENRGARNRWFTGTLLAAAGIVSGLVFNILSSIK